MNTIKKTSLLLIVTFNAFLINAQQSVQWQTNGENFVNAVENYLDKSYNHSQRIFDRLLTKDATEKEKAVFYEALTRVYLQEKGAEQKLVQFTQNYPVSVYTQSTFINIGNYFYALGDYSKAFEWYKHVNPNKINDTERIDFYFRTGYTAFNQGDIEVAKNLFKQTLQTKYGVDSQYYLGHIYYTEKDYTEAFKYLEPLREHRYYRERVLIYLTQINFFNENYKGAIADGTSIEKDIKNKRQRSEIHKIIGESYFKLKKYKKALPYLEDASKILKLSNADYYQLGVIYNKVNQNSKALEMFNKISNEQSNLGQNAYYQLAKLYADAQKKNQALTAYRKVSQMNFDQNLKENAHLNYAKLSYELGNPYESVYDALNGYLTTYPNTKETEEVKQLLVNSLESSKQYKKAVEVLKTIDSDQTKYSESHQKINYFYAVQLYNQASYSKALDYFNASLQTPIQKKYVAKSYFWKGETLAKLGQEKQALVAYQKFKENNTETQSTEAKQFPYHLGYVYYKLGDYTKAIPVFESYLESNNDSATSKDAQLRLADAYFATKNYQKAYSLYDSYVKTNPSNSAYAAYQAAESSGLKGDRTTKIEILNQLIDQQKKSAYIDNALFSLANTYSQTNKTNEAITSYSKLIKKYESSSLIPESYYRRGLLYFSSNQRSEAIRDFKTVAKKYPESPLAIQSVNNVKNIMIKDGKIDAFENWIQKLKYVKLDDLQLEKSVYLAAEKQYQLTNYKSAIRNFVNYKHKYPEGVYYINAIYYLAESYYQTNKFNDAAQNFEEVRVKTNNTEQKEHTLLRMSQIYFKNKNPKYIQTLEELLKNTQNQDYLYFVQYELMKAYSNNNNNAKAIELADIVRQSPKADAVAKEEADLTKARAFFKQSKFEKANTLFNTLETAQKSEVRAEAFYYKSYSLNSKLKFDKSNDIIFSILEDYSNEKYWGAKSSLIMADNFYKLDDLFQAKTILEMLLESFSEYKDITQEAQRKLDFINQKNEK